MNLFGAISRRYRALGVLAVTAALAGALGSGGPASAALSGSDWVARSLPAGFVIGTDSPMAPVSCVAGTKFCVVVTSNENDLISMFGEDFIGQAPLVTTNGGRTWTGYGQLTSTFTVEAVSCPTTSECWAAGENFQDKPALAESTDGGQTWTDMPSPQVSSSDSWAVRGIDCPTTTTCYVVGLDNTTSIAAPAAAVTTDGGATWQVITGNLPAAAANPGGAYELDSISCLTATSCVAAGGLNGGGASVVISTSDGGSTWTASADPALNEIQEIFGISCVPASSGPATCFAAGTHGDGSVGPVVLVSHDGGTTWGGEQVFDDTGWFQSISCVSARHCWAAGAGTHRGARRDPQRRQIVVRAGHLGYVQPAGQRVLPER